MPLDAGALSVCFMDDQLNALDATFLELEEADDTAHMHIGGIMLFEPWDDGGAPPLALIRDEIDARVIDLPRYRQRLSSPKTGGLQWPRWVDDDRYDVAHHVFAAALPGAADQERLLHWAGAYYSQRLDRSRPLWEVAVLELADGTWAMATKTHHCLVDGVGSVDVANTLLDSAPHAEPRRTDRRRNGAARRSREDSSLPPLIRVAARSAGAALETTGTAVHAVGSGLRAAAGAIETPVRHPRRVLDAVTRARAMVEVLVNDEVVAAPSTSLNQPIGGHRRLEVRAVPVERLKEIKRALGGTLNDVVLTATTAGLHDLLRSRGEELPSQGLRAMVPVNIRTAGDSLSLGNRITSLFVHLPVDEVDPLARYRRQMEEAETLKAGTQATGSLAMMDLAGHAPPVLHSFLARGLFATRLFNVTITNVPGPQQPLYAFGSRLAAVWPIVPLAACHAVGVAAFSYDGMLFLCLNADHDSTQDLSVLADGIVSAIDELHDLAGSSSSRGGGAPRARQAQAAARSSRRARPASR